MFSFSTVNQAKEWKTSYIRAIDYLGDPGNQCSYNKPKEGGKMNMMITGEDRQALQTPVDNGIIALQIQETPKLIHNIIQKQSRQTPLALP